MRAWLLTVGEPLPCDGPNERLHRTGLLAEALHSRGHEVLWWSSTFDHARKRFRESTRPALGRKSLPRKCRYRSGDGPFVLAAARLFNASYQVLP